MRQTGVENMLNNVRKRRDHERAQKRGDSGSPEKSDWKGKLRYSHSHV